MWIIQNSMEIHSTINKCRGKARNVKTFDFSTLYTSLPHTKLVDRISIWVTKAFASKCEYIKVNKVKARWTNSARGATFTCNTVIALIHWLIDNTYVTIGKQVFKQSIGIPMGTDCAPYLANLFLFSFEFDFMNQQLKEKNFDILRKFNKCFRYIDDILVINNDNLMEEFKTKIYPPELVLTSDDKSDLQVNFLDLHLEVKIKIFTIACMTNAISSIFLSLISQISVGTFLLVNRTEFLFHN
jgi:hypothetical protein